MTGDSDEKEDDQTKILSTKQIESSEKSQEKSIINTELGNDPKALSTTSLQLSVADPREESKILSKEVLVNKKLRKNIHKGSAGSEKDYELSIRTSIPQINTKSILRNKVLSTSKSTNLQSQSQITISKEDDEFFSSKAIPEAQNKIEENEQPISAPLRETDSIRITLEENDDKFADKK